MKKLYFIRHGLSEHNVMNIYSGITDSLLTAKGRQQAKIAGKYAKGLNIDLIVSSPLKRTIETAQIIAKELSYPKSKIRVNPILIERNFGELEGKKSATAKKRRGVDKIEGYENDKEMLKRAERAFEWLESLDGENILVVSHGGFGRTLRKVAIAEHDFHEAIPNAEIVCWIEDHES